MISTNVRFQAPAGSALPADRSAGEPAQPQRLERRPTPWPEDRPLPATGRQAAAAIRQALQGPIPEEAPAASIGRCAKLRKKGALPKDARIAIIGAGPAGMTSAAELIKRGYENVTVLEREDRVGGRCKTTPRGNDMGAVLNVKFFYDHVTKLTDALGIERPRFPKGHDYRLSAGREDFSKPGFGKQLKIAGQGLRYLFNHIVRWDGVKGPAIGKVSPELRQNWSELVAQKGYQDLAQAAFVPTTGFGYRPDVPAVYNARDLTPSSLAGLMLGAHSWKGGTQQIWEKLRDRDAIDVRTGADIQRIERGAQGVDIFLGDGQDGQRRMHFDELIMACNPAEMLGALDATPEEQALYSRFKTVDYRTFECRIDNFLDKQAGGGTFVDNEGEGGLNRPVLFLKLNDQDNVAVLYVNATPDTSNEQVIENIRADLTKLGANLVEVLEADNWKYFPHVDKAALDDDFFVKLDAIQGKNHTLGAGAAYTFDCVPDAMAHATYQVDRLVRGKLPGTQAPS